MMIIVHHPREQVRQQDARVNKKLAEVQHPLKQEIMGVVAQQRKVEAAAQQHREDMDARIGGVEAEAARRKT